MTAAGQRGSALVVALLVSFVLGLLGMSFLVMAQTESQIARNETLGLQALYAAESGARVVRAWFDRPGAAVGFPPPGVVVRARVMIDESDPYGSGSTPGQQYKQTSGELFRWPYRGSVEDTLLGKETDPDMRIVDQDYLDGLTDTLFGAYPDPEGWMRARITAIDVFAPPYVRSGTTWVRHGVATIRVVAGVYRFDMKNESAPPRRFAERTVRLVLGQVPYTTPVFGPVHVCGDLNLVGKLRAHWGTVTATGSVTALPDFAAFDVPRSVPRGVPPGPRIDRLWSTDPLAVDAYDIGVDPSVPIDPWLRLISAGPLVGAPTNDPQPFDPTHPGMPFATSDRSNVIQNHPLVGCPEYDYAFWKQLSMSGRPGTHYYAWSTGDRFKRDGTGPDRTLQQIFSAAAGEPGLYFFETRDRQPPVDDDADGVFDNLTPPIALTGSLGARGFVYLNAESVDADSVTNTLTSTFRAPGEPFVGDHEAWVNVDYATSLAQHHTIGGGGAWNAIGPAFDDQLAFHGILYTSGSLRVSRIGTFNGSLIARSGATLDGAALPIAKFYWDASLAEQWPLVGWQMPRVFDSRATIEP